jgi:hypothetical protein
MIETLLPRNKRQRSGFAPVSARTTKYTWTQRRRATLLGEQLSELARPEKFETPTPDSWFASNTFYHRMACKRSRFFIVKEAFLLQ